MFSVLRNTPGVEQFGHTRA
ncbi:hypothetical protein E2C01_087828 [Portunus trituberculatus]|uniref:Uncharacterized protein n=1 Tax=Portunus trituberculatus TaxID=210409 RepID=A0A5B7J968_PORTR|nr:hypothetical protein [Portunus trituberculatus]